jgi:hypothetical protein
MCDNVYTFNRAWEVGATVNEVLQGNESGLINGNDATASALPSPPVAAFDPDGNAIAGWGNSALIPASEPDGGYAAYLPQGARCRKKEMKSVMASGSIFRRLFPGATLHPEISMNLSRSTGFAFVQDRECVVR